MRKKLLDRRKECLKYAFRGANTTKWVKEIAEKYEITEEAVYTDWRKRHEWIPEVYDSADVVDAAKDLLAQKAQVREEAWLVYSRANAEQLSAKVGALKLINQSVSEHLENLQSLGKIHKEADKIELQHDIDITAEELKDIYSEYVEDEE